MYKNDIKFLVDVRRLLVVQDLQIIVICFFFQRKSFIESTANFVNKL